MAGAADMRSGLVGFGWGKVAGGFRVRIAILAVVQPTVAPRAGG